MGFEDVNVLEPLPSAQARKLVSSILNEGEVIFTRHAQNALADDDKSESDALNVLRGGRIYEPAEWENGGWRYRIHTQRFCIVVEFDSITLLVVVTFWEKK